MITIAAVLSWAVLSVASRIVLVNFGLDPWMFSFLQLVAGGITLLAIGYRGARARRSFTRVSTWALGALRVLSASLYTAVLASISVLEAGTIGAINLPVVSLLVLLWSRIWPRPMAWPGHILILVAVAWMAMRLQSDTRTVVMGLMGLNALCLAGMNLIAEHHPENKSATPAGRAWFSGVVLAITAAVFLIMRVLQGADIVGAFSLPLILSSIAVGVFLRAPSMFLTFWAISVAGAQGYTAAIAFLPLFGMALEQGAVAVGLLDTSRFQYEFLYIAILALIGTLVVWTANRAAHQTAQRRG
ncbi:hypothetical protein [Sedimentitalea sp. XS_ASV28]|uniref:hypothetical protein n=1 Tax=Sedimentitalea sp. XS_ASV28 TaxID=3241296 RepID=UPI0035150572